MFCDSQFRERIHEMEKEDQAGL